MPGREMAKSEKVYAARFLVASATAEVMIRTPCLEFRPIGTVVPMRPGIARSRRRT
jgi:hypothetical protein